MEPLETLQQYYENTCRATALDLQRGGGLTRHFNVFVRDNCLISLPYTRRDYYKICLCKGKAMLYSEKGELEVTRPTLFFSGPQLQFGWRNISEQQQGYVCVFNEVFVTADIRAELQLLNQVFESDHYPLVALSDEQFEQIGSYFETMVKEYKGDFEYKEAMIRQILKLIILSGIKIRQSLSPLKPLERKELLVGRFLDLLDAQFPIDSPRSIIGLKAPADFAVELGVHINHLNHIIKAHTAKTTGQLIAEKKMAEALSLLKNTDWPVSQIGRSLGFEYPQYFNLFFKKQTGSSPKAYRSLLASHI